MCLSIGSIHHKSSTRLSRAALEHKAFGALFTHFVIVLWPCHACAPDSSQASAGGKASLREDVSRGGEQSSKWALGYVPIERSSYQAWCAFHACCTTKCGNPRGKGAYFSYRLSLCDLSCVSAWCSRALHLLSAETHDYGVRIINYVEDRVANGRSCPQ